MYAEAIPNKSQSEVQPTPVICIYHGNCADGFGAAWVVRKFFQEQNPSTSISFYAGVYGQEPPDVTGHEVIIVDFSYKRPVMEAIALLSEGLLVLDHHKTAQEDLVGLEEWAASHVSQPSDVHVHFDMGRSGALMAWNHFFPNESVLNLIKTIDDRDRWQFKLPHTREKQAALFSYPYDFDTWSGLMFMNENPTSSRSFAQEGEAIERKHFKDIYELLAVCKRTMIIGGVEVPVASIPYTMSSDAGHIMAKGSPTFAACYIDKHDGRVFSLRSDADGGADVSAIAKQYGGGGHKNAAGFQVPRDHPLATC